MCARLDVDSLVRRVGAGTIVVIVISIGEEKVVMLMGNTGVGKSSVGCRLLGSGPALPDRPFKVSGAGKSVTLHVDTVTRTWFGDETLPSLTVVDTPGNCEGNLSMPWDATGDHLLPLVRIFMHAFAAARLPSTCQDLLHTFVHRLQGLVTQGGTTKTMKTSLKWGNT